MKKLLFVLIATCFVNFLHAQEDTPRYFKYPATYGVSYPRLWSTKVLRIPNDTLAINALPGAIAEKSGAFYFWNGLRWTQVSSQGDLTIYLKIADSTKYTTPYALNAYTWERSLDALNGSKFTHDHVIQAQQNAFNVYNTGQFRFSTLVGGPDGDSTYMVGQYNNLTISTRDFIVRGSVMDILSGGTNFYNNVTLNSSGGATYFEGTQNYFRNGNTVIPSYMRLTYDPTTMNGVTVYGRYAGNATEYLMYLSDSSRFNSGAGTAGQIAYYTAANKLTSSPGLQFNGTNKVLSIYNPSMVNSVFNAINGPTAIFSVERNHAVNPPSINLYRWMADSSAVTNNQLIGAVNMGGGTSKTGTTVTTASNAAGIWGTSTENWSTTKQGANIIFYVTPNGKATASHVFPVLINGNNNGNGQLLMLGSGQTSATTHTDTTSRMIIGGQIRTGDIYLDSNRAGNSDTDSTLLIRSNAVKRGAPQNIGQRVKDSLAANSVNIAAGAGIRIDTSIVAGHTTYTFVNTVANNPMRALLWSNVQLSNTAGTTTENTVYTGTIPGGTLSANGSYRITLLVSSTNSANNKTFKVKIGGTIVLQVTITASASARYQQIISNRNATNSQISGAFGSSTGMGYNVTSSTAVSTYSIDTSIDQTLTVTLQNANSGETCAIEQLLVEAIN